MSTLTKRAITPAELLAMPDGKSFELVDGELVERNVGVLAGLVEAIVCRLVGNYCAETRCGFVWTGTTGSRCFSDDPNRVRKPDLAYVRKERFREEYLADGFLTIPADLVVEVVSPNDLAYEVLEKVEEYLAAGIPLIWIIDPEARIVHVYRIDGSVSKLNQESELSGEDIIPGFRCKVADFFPPATMSERAKG
jgi:Uma2 family endonuclease